ncbi:MAG: type I-B CRISPR-associated protein Cas7/Csh2 [Candidatus Levybacteria bacterium RBG_16_35_11]|nr:MAG: type I-B CRISPR-associated protein Cas7/Csh2 [Candidatus Levybacteria bacterium RBG_16_35_11]
MTNCIKNRNEFLFLYDIKNGNPNGDPDENRPRIDKVTNRCYVTDVRLKRFVRDYIIQTEGKDLILVTKLGTKLANLTERVKESLTDGKESKIEGEELLKILKEKFLDLRMFGSPLAFKNAPEEWGERSSLTGPIQINFGETLNHVEEVTFHGWSSIPFEPGQEGSTPTTYYAIPYGLIAFHGVANENAAKTTYLTENDLKKFKIALWKGIREAISANTRTKREQQPRLLLNIVYKENIEIEENGEKKKVPTEYHIGALEEKIILKPTTEIKEDINIRKIGDYTLDFSKLINALKKAKDKIERVEYCLSPEFAELYGDNLISAITAIDGKIKIENLNIDYLK